MRCVLVLASMFLQAYCQSQFDPMLNIESGDEHTGRRSATETPESGDDTDSEEDVNDRFQSVQEVLPSKIDNSFVNKRSFSCPRAKPLLHTGQSTADLSPEDIDIIAALGDSLATGKGLWPGTDIEFRGASFPIGGDATIDGLVTFPNILLEFNERVFGVSHGMGTREQLPEEQFNCAQSGAKTTEMPQQANELIRRLNLMYGKEKLKHLWVMLVITVGTEELCGGCSLPDYSALHRTMTILSHRIPKVFVILVGPIHVSYSHQLKSNLLGGRCECMQALSKTGLRTLVHGWADVFYRLQNELNHANTFGLLAIPSLTIASRYPESLFIKGQPLLNRKGHTYAAKWLWNRLMTGPEYNISDAVLSKDSYYCPSVGCPYFRTVANRRSCEVLSEEQWLEISMAESSSNETSSVPSRRETLQEHIVLVIVVINVFALLSVTFFGTIFYRRGLKNTQSRFEAAPGV